MLPLSVQQTSPSSPLALGPAEDTITRSFTTTPFSSSFFLRTDDAPDPGFPLAPLPVVDLREATDLAILAKDLIHS
jgi:hypothetical protein